MYQAIEKRFKQEANAYNAIRDLVTPKVVRWEYFLAPAWHWRPDWELSHQPATKKNARYGYGYDRSNKVIVILSHMNAGSSVEEFLRYSKDRIESSEFFKGALREVETGFLKNGQVVRIEQAGRNGSCIETVEWDGDRATRMQTQYSDEKFAREFVYDEESKSFEVKFRVKPDGTRVPIDQPLPKGVTMKSLAAQIRKHLVKGVGEVVARSKIKEPIYCVVLVYSGEGNPVFPPTIAIGLESQRQKWLKKNGEEAKEMIWNPEEFTHRGKEIDDEDYEQACEWYSDAMEERTSDAAAVKLINEIAADVGKLNWKRLAKMTDDFVVFAVDLEGADLQKNMKKSVPATVLKKLKAKGVF